MRLRVASSDDATPIAALHAASWRVAYRGMLSDAYLDGDVFEDRSQLWSARLAAPAPAQYVAVIEAVTSDAGGAVGREREGPPRLAGFVCAYAAHDPTWGTLLDNLHVAPEFQRQGLGRQLMAASARWCISNAPDARMYLWVLEANTPAQSFYARLGGRDVGGESWSPPGGGAVALCRYAWSSLAPLTVAA
jgi:ribosomal protein S18 acetylase RimI-like enzyme